MKSRIPYLLLLLLLSACKRPESVPYETHLDGLTDLNAIARLGVPPTQLLSSYDRRGANEDYNHFQGRTKEGQCILADLKGPGVVTRFWFTGIGSDKRIRFFFDGEKAPRFDFTWDELRAGVPPFDIEPLAVDEQNCWHSFVPVPFAKRLIITTEDAGYRYGQAPKMYYQINWNPVPVGHAITSLSPSTDFKSLQKVSDVWRSMNFAPLPEATQTLSVAPGKTMELWSGAGPATIEAFTFDSTLHNAYALRNVLLKIYWDGNAEPSVAVPLGDFFGSVGQRWRASSMFFGSVGNTFFCRFPMPFEKSARFVIENQGDMPFSARFGIKTGPRIAGGYFHAGWRKSGANETGTPHTVLSTKGRGRYVGCILSVASADKSFWVLESDESMFIDGKWAWQGTGLEDYFNSGWYYGNVFARPLHGLPAKAPFRATQYRIHLGEPILFSNSFNMIFERGPKQASHAAYESTAFYYLEHPQKADGSLKARKAPLDPMRQYTIMTELWNCERFGDLVGEIELIDAYNASFKAPWREMLELRKRVCQYESKQIAKPVFIDELKSMTNPHAKALLELYATPKTALIQLYSKMKSELYLDGKRILQASDPRQPVFATMQLAKGAHVLAVASAWQEYPKWTQVAVRNSEGFVLGTSGEWKHTVNPTGSWAALDYDDSSWRSDFNGYDARVKGPPEAPHVFVSPDPFVNTLSQASGLRPSIPWPSKKGHVVYRKVFTVE